MEDQSGKLLVTAPQLSPYRHRVPGQRLDITRRPGPYVREHHKVLGNLALALLSALSLPRSARHTFSYVR